MGRAGGGGGRSGGGGHRSSGGGGSRGSGGRSVGLGGSHQRAGGRSTFGPSNNRGHSGGGYGGYGGHHHHDSYGYGHHHHHGYGYGRRYYPAGYYGGSYYPAYTYRNPVSTVVWVMFLLLCIVIAARSIVPRFNYDVTSSTIVRTALPRGAVVETSYYTDELGWIGNRTKLEQGLKNFYNKTGVQPHVYITGNIQGQTLEQFTSQKYDELFEDEAHLLLVFYEINDSPQDWYVCGSQAKSVIDGEAADILLDYIDRYYYSDNLTDEEFFSKAFNDAGNKIMSKGGGPSVGTVLAVVYVASGVVAVVTLIVAWRIKKRNELYADLNPEDVTDAPVGSGAPTDPGAPPDGA